MIFRKNNRGNQMKVFLVTCTVVFMLGCAKQPSNFTGGQSTNRGQGIPQIFVEQQEKVDATCGNLKERPGFAVIADKVILNNDGSSSPPLRMLSLKTKPNSPAELDAIERLAKLNDICTNLWVDFFRPIPSVARVAAEGGTAGRNLLLQLYQGKISYGAYNRESVKLDKEVQKRVGQAVRAAVQQRQQQSQADSMRALQMGWALSNANPANQTYRAPINTTCRRYGNEMLCESY